MESNSNSKLKAITGSKNMMGLYDKKSSFKKELKIKSAKNTQCLVFKIHKARQLLQKTCANRRPYS